MFKSFKNRRLANRSCSENRPVDQKVCKSFCGFQMKYVNMVSVHARTKPLKLTCQRHRNWQQPRQTSVFSQDVRGGLVTNLRAPRRSPCSWCWGVSGAHRRVLWEIITGGGRENHCLHPGRRVRLRWRKGHVYTGGNGSLLTIYLMFWVGGHSDADLEDTSGRAV